TQIKKRIEGSGSAPYVIDDSELLLAELFAGEGYETAAVAPDRYFSKSHWSTLTAGFGEVDESPLRVRGPHNSPAVTDSAIALLKRVRKQPLFLWVHYYDAHSPHV